MVEAFPYGYDRLDESTPVPLRKPLSQVRRDAIEEAIESGVTVEVLMNSPDLSRKKLRLTSACRRCCAPR